MEQDLGTIRKQQMSPALGKGILASIFENGFLWLTWFHLSPQFQSNHPHVIYEYSDKSPQGCAVSSSYDNPLSGKRRKKRSAETGSGESGNTANDFLKFIREKREVRQFQKFIELALVLDKAMVMSERGAKT